MPSWIEDIQGYTTVLDENGDPVERRHAFQIVGATVTDNGSVTVIEVPPGATGEAPAASQTEAGIVELATAVEANALTSTTLAITPGTIPLATDTQRGVVELATAAEANALTSTTLAVTPGTVPLATDTQRGVIEIATAAEVQALASLTLAVTPGTLPIASITQRGTMEIATSTEVQTGTDQARAVCPAFAGSHQSAAKFWLVANTAGVLQDSYNVTSVTDTGTGTLTITIATDFANVNWCAQVSVELPDATPDTAAESIVVGIIGGKTAGSAAFQCFQAETPYTVQDPFMWHVCGFGDQ
jgi:hypothetical protein